MIESSITYTMDNRPKGIDPMERIYVAVQQTFVQRIFGPLHPMENNSTEMNASAVYPMERNSDGEAVNNVTR